MHYGIFEPSHGIAHFCTISLLSHKFAEFGTSQWCRGQYGKFWSSSGRHTVCVHDFAMKYTTITRALMGGILKILSWACLKCCMLLWWTECICQLQLPVTNTAYLVGFGGHRKLITMWKICPGVPRNVANRPVEFGKICHGKLWSPFMRLRTWSSKCKICVPCSTYTLIFFCYLISYGICVLRWLTFYIAYTMAAVWCIFKNLIFNVFVHIKLKKYLENSRKSK